MPPPVPREHGAWVMLYAPLLTGLVAYGVDPAISAGLLVLATALFWAQNAAGLLLRGRSAPGHHAWLALYVAVGLGAGSMLVFAADLWLLTPLALPAAALLAVQGWRRRATRRQIDHSTANEMISAAIMASGCAAACLAAHGNWTPSVAVGWGAFAMYFAGTVLYVKMRVSALRGGIVDGAVGRQCVLWHIGLVGGAVLWFVVEPANWTAPVASIPALVRAVIGRWRPRRVALRRLGLSELVFAVWFSLWVGVALARTSVK